MSTLGVTIDSRRFRDALGRFATGVTVVTTSHDSQLQAMTANGFMSVSLDPPLVVVSIATRARMHDILLQSGRYGVSVLAADQDHLSRHFGGRPVEGLTVTFLDGSSVPLIDGALLQLATRVVDVREAGDHSLFVGEVLQLEQRDGPPLIFFSGGYRELREASIAADSADLWAGFCLDPLGPHGATVNGR